MLKKKGGLALEKLGITLQSTKAWLKKDYTTEGKYIMKKLLNLQVNEVLKKHLEKRYLIKKYEENSER
jgi:hypothetical protein